MGASSCPVNAIGSRDTSGVASAVCAGGDCTSAMLGFFVVCTGGVLRRRCCVVLRLECCLSDDVAWELLECQANASALK